MTGHMGEGAMELDTVLRGLLLFSPVIAGIALTIYARSELT